MALLKLKIFTVLVLSSVSIIRAYEHDEGDHHLVGYSFSKFSGPVSGPAKEVITHDEHHGKIVDYVAKPDYQFEYGVEDPKAQLSQFRKENRNDDTVVGEYSYTDPLGHVRTVKYTADKVHGFRADIYIDGKLETPHLPEAPKHNYHEQPEEEEEISEGYHDEGDY